MNGYTDEESAKNIHKIINIISKEVTIDKQSALLKMANLK
jgi:hypothetical protein